LRIWSPVLAKVDEKAPIQVAIAKARRFSTSPEPWQMSLDQPVILPERTANERLYALPSDLKLEPQTEYTISGWIQDQPKMGRLFKFEFYTGPDGQPAAY
jgi:hypothetical protein